MKIGTALNGKKHHGGTTGVMENIKTRNQETISLEKTKKGMC